jgi:replicative DNA helicase
MSEPVTPTPFPFSKIIEKAVLAILVSNPELIHEALNLTPEHFYSPGYGGTFAYLRDTMAVNGSAKSIDVDSMIDTLARTGILESMGGYAEIIGITNDYHPREHFTSHVKTLNEFLARRMAMKVAHAMIEAATEQLDISELTEAMGPPVTAIFDTLAEAKPPASTSRLVRESLQRYLDRANGIASPMGIETGINEIDKALHGLHPGRMWVIGAYPSGGKSVLAGQILIHVAVNETPSVFITLEMSEADMTDRFIIQESNAPALAFSDPVEFARETSNDGPTAWVRDKIQNAAKKMLTSPFIIRRPSNHSLAAVLSTLRRAHREMGAKVAAIDYVQLINAPGSNREQEISAISHGIQAIAHELQMHVMVLSQLNEEGDTKHGRVIEEDADAFLQIIQERDKKKVNYKQHQHILIAKDRHYGKGGDKLPLILSPTTIKFVVGYPVKIETKTTAAF